MSDFYLTLTITGTPGNMDIHLRNRRVLSKGKWKVALEALTYTKSPWKSFENQNGIWPNNVPSVKDTRITVSVFHNQLNTSNVESFADFSSDMPGNKQIYGNLSNKAFFRPGVTSHFCVETFCSLPPAYYENPGDFASALVTSFNSLRSQYHPTPLTLSYDYNPVQKSVTITGADAYAFYNGNDFITGMGLEGGEPLMYTGQQINDCRVFYGKLIGSNGRPPKLIKYLLVTSNIVKYERAVNRMAQLLATIPIMMSDNERFEYIPRRREYKPVSVKVLNDLNFRLTGIDGVPIKISHGRVTMKLHFKKATSIN